MRPLRIIFLPLLLVFGLVLFKPSISRAIPINGGGPAPDPCLPDSWVIVECSPVYVKCCGSSWSSPCTGPWQRWEWRNCIVRPRAGGEDIVCNEFTEVTGNCYTTDACYAVSGYPSSNSTGLIWPGQCDTWAGGTCHWGPVAYKRCCQGATPKPCSISAPYDYECDQGGGVIWGTTCPVPETHTECDYGSRTCKTVTGSGTNQCSTFADCTRKKCVETTCTLVDERGSDLCTSDPDCAAPTHKECVGESCQTVAGGGADLCTSDPDCAVPTHKECVGTSCVPVSGGGADLCTSDPDCEAPPPPQYYKKCSGGSCVTVEGAGSDQCSSDDQCRHYYCSGSGLSATCKLSLSPGSNECSWDPDCRPPECTQTTINGGATYTNSRGVTLSLSASNMEGDDQMRFRNQIGNWSSWEAYRTSKGWTLTSGDGEKTVTAQYKNDIGRSVVISACKDSIILDTRPPISSMTPLPAWSTGASVTLSWSGTDNLTPANELKYWLQYNKDGSSWIDLLGSQTIPTGDTSWDFYGEKGVLYCFRVRARDLAGNWEDWPFPYDTCTSIDLGIEMYGFGWVFGDSTPNVWVSVFDGVSGINYSALQCWYSSNGGSTWTARTCNYASTDPTTVSMLNVPFQSQSGTRNKARFKACDVAGTCLTNTYTVDNRTTGPWVQTFGGDIHGNSRIQLREAP